MSRFMSELWINQLRETTIRLMDSQVTAISDVEVARESRRTYADDTVRIHGEMVAPTTLDQWEHDIFADPMVHIAGKGSSSTAPYIREVHHRRPLTLDRSMQVRREAIGDCSQSANEEWKAHMLSLAKRLNESFPQVRFTHKLGLTSSLTGYANTDGRKLLSTVVQENHELLWHLPGSDRLFDGSYEVREAVIDADLRFEHIAALVGAGVKGTSFGMKDVLGENIRVAFFSDEYEFQKTLMTDLHISSLKSGRNRLGTEFNSDLEMWFERGNGHTPCFFDETGGVCDGGVRLIGDGKLLKRYGDYVTQLELGSDYEEMAATWSAYDGIPGLGYHPIMIRAKTREKVKDDVIPDLWKGDVLWLHDFGGSRVTDDGIWNATIQNACLMRDGRPLGWVGGFMATAVVEDMLGKDFKGLSAPFSEGTHRRMLHCGMTLTRP